MDHSDDENLGRALGPGGMEKMRAMLKAAEEHGDGPEESAVVGWRKGTPEELRLAETKRALPPEMLDPAIMARDPDEGVISRVFEKLEQDLKGHGLELHFDMQGFPRAKPHFSITRPDAKCSQ